MAIAIANISGRTSGSVASKRTMSISRLTVMNDQRMAEAAWPPRRAPSPRGVDEKAAAGKSHDSDRAEAAVRKETAKPKAGRPKAYVFSYRAPTKAFKLQLRFAKSRVEKDEVIAALEGIIAELRK